MLTGSFTALVESPGGEIPPRDSTTPVLPSRSRERPESAQPSPSPWDRRRSAIHTRSGHSSADRRLWVIALNRCRDSRCAGVPLAGSEAS
jgi:hypothetical protein